jgi:hypothetical protein
VGQKKFYTFYTASARGDHERGFTIPPRGFGVGSGSQEFFDYFCVARATGESERSFAVFIGGIDVGASFQKSVDRISLVEEDGPGKCRGAVRLNRVYVRFGCEKRSKSLTILILQGIDQTKVVGRRKSRDGQHPCKGKLLNDNSNPHDEV